MPGYSTPISAEVVLQAKAMLEKGDTPNIVASALGLHVSTVGNWVKRGWPKRVMGVSFQTGRKPNGTKQVAPISLIERFSNPSVSLADELSLAVASLADDLINMAARLENSRQAIAVLKALETQFEEIRQLRHRVDSLEEKAESYRQKLINGALVTR